MSVYLTPLKLDELVDRMGYEFVNWLQESGDLPFWPESETRCRKHVQGLERRLESFAPESERGLVMEHSDGHSNNKAIMYDFGLFLGLTLGAQIQADEDRQRLHRWRPQNADEKYSAIVRAMQVATKFTDDWNESLIGRELGSGPKQVAAT